MMPAPDHEHAHHHGTGVRWLDIVVGLSAMFISVISLIVSIQHGKTMEKMVEQNEKLVAASTMPFLDTYGSQVDPVTHKPVMRLTLKNGGVGPAIIGWFQLRYKGKAYTPHSGLIRDCCAAALTGKTPQDANMLYGNLSGRIIPARETDDFLTLDASENPLLFQSFNEARKDMDLRACFCSVLNECWITNFDFDRPKPVEKCEKPKDEAVW